MKKQTLLIATMALFLAGCGSDNQAADTTNTEKTSLQKAADHAKESAKHVGDAVSESTEAARKKWTEMNKDRIESPSGEADTMPVEQPKADMDAIKKKYEEVKQVTVEKTNEMIEKAKEMTK
ncbi:MAG: hypothetical protein OQL20_09320 [Sedimenticola sp.]|nr:hypothetical protein [Sedimenticola sp.]